MEIKRLSRGEERELEKLRACFDRPVRADAATRFLDSDDHHILVAYERDIAVGFVTGVETTHPDKGTEMFLYELAVDERFRRLGVGSALVSALADLARRANCYGMWVGTEDDNAAALATYAAAGATGKSEFVMLEWKFDGEKESR